MSTWDNDRQLAHALTGDVAEALGDGWSAQINPEHWGGTIVGPNGAELFLRVAGGKATISGCYPQGAYQKVYRYELFEIGVSVKRGPVTIASEIVRRLLPKYLPELERVTQGIEAHDAGVSRQDELARSLATVAGVEHVRDGGFSSLYANGSFHGSVQVNHGGESVNVELRYLSPGEAARVLGALYNKA